ncbi:hypothetical protein D187_009714 [Cystobacter fuscus DSM 2262]|uniref:Lipoprotein n=1 Tax=Cystobacter fuscus (strain ATCC 25194 / DSM 2262 / NBRC 100088 / M29) TaxID=1242864 RepID=S9NS79_CYSF2|nr:hypothetical protein [Cystobacter fuscus]EPX54975.1 hypothetical protein D187_009714 [Cystobacter fuscus DSM 2262]
MRSWTRFAGALVCVWLAGCVESKTEEGGAEVPDTTQDCIPTSCDSAGASCGLLGDGCGGTLNCGTCAAGTTCGASGAANVCGAGSCTPKTCAELDAHCGQVSDGCAAVLDCGRCAAGQSCGASAANQCATPPPAWGTISWVGLGGPLAYRSVTANPGGTRIFIGTASGGEDRLQALTADNTPVWFQPSEIEITQLRMSPDGLGVFATGYPVRGMPRPELTYRYSLNGANVSLLGNSISDDCGLKAAGTNSGQVALLSTCAFYTTLRLRPSATWEFEPEDTFRMWRVAVDGQGNILVAGYTTGPTALGDKHFGAQGQRGLLVVKFNPQGGVVWAHELIPEGGEALPSAIAVSSLGTVVVAGTFQGIAHWASKDYDSANGATFLLTLEANGASRWLRQSRVADAVMALDPSGRAFLAGRAADCAGGIRIEEINLAGDPLGTKRLGCGGNLAARDAAALGHDLVLLGAYSGANDFGNGTRTDADGSGTFLLRMSAP